MSGWISSKLKVAENLLQQIDQQAAESLRKNDHPSPSPDRRHFDEEAPSNVIPSSPVVPLKLQISKKATQSDRSQDSRQSDRVSDGRNAQQKMPDAAARVSAKAVAKVDEDWTELLATVPAGNRSGAALLELQGSGRRLAKVERRAGASAGDGSSRKLSAPGLDVKESSKGLVEARGKPKIGSGEENVIHSVEAERISDVVSVATDAAKVGGGPVSGNENAVASEIVVLKGEIDGGDDGCEGTKSGETHRSSAAVGSSIPYPEFQGSEGSDSDSESESSSESENETEQKRLIAEKAAAMAAEAIKERENFVARLEGEKQTLQKILEERKKQQAEEALEIQTTMMEKMEAVELEKQRHNSTRMEALARLAALETTNADLAKSLASAQWNLEVEVKRIAGLQQQIEFKKLAQEDLKRKMEKLQSLSSSEKKASEGAEYERGILEAEFSFLCDKVLQLKDKAKKLEDSIEMTKKEMVESTEAEVELKDRLDQLTDCLIKKQTQVEALSADKAMLIIKIESLSRYIQDGGTSIHDDVVTELEGPSARIDVEAGSWDPSHKLSAVKLSKIRAAESHLSTIIRQMDSLFSVGVSFLRRNPNARVWSVLYLLLLHLWVFYVLSSHPRPTNNGRSGAVFSLETINKTSP